MTDRSKLMWMWPIAGFLAFAGFGTGLTAMAVFGGGSQGAGVVTSSAPGPQRIEVELGDLYMKPASLRAEAGEPITLALTNAGQAEHNFSLPGHGTSPMIAPGDSYILELPALDAGKYEFLCAVAGHADGGMSGMLIVGDKDSAPQPASHDMGGMHAMSPEEMAEHDAEVTASFPAETKGIGGQTLEAQVVEGVKVFEVTADELKWEVAPGEFKQAWAYNGMVPGPQIEAELGDRVRIVLHNKLAEPTTLHFHGLRVPAGMDGVPVVSHDAVMPGDSFTYEFTVRDSGSHMYHSHFNAAKQVPMGLLGGFIVPDPKDPKVDHDTTMVLNDGPLGYTLNGKGFPATAPIAVNRGDVVRIRYMNEGLQVHPMHLHGLIQKVIAKDGHLLEQPYEADTILVGPGERYDVIVRATESGIWAFHCHVLNHVEGPNGMFGMVTAMVVQ